MCRLGSCVPSASSAAQPRQAQLPARRTGSPTPSVIESPKAANVVILSLPLAYGAPVAPQALSSRHLHWACRLENRLIVADQLVAQGLPGAAEHLLPRRAPLSGAQFWLGGQLGHGGGQRAGVAWRHQEPGDTVVDQVERPADRGRDDRQAAGRGLLEGL